MCSYLRSIYNDEWSIIKNGWKCLTYISKTSIVEPKHVVGWNKEELCLNNLNCQGLHVIVIDVTT